MHSIRKQTSDGVDSFEVIFIPAFFAPTPFHIVASFTAADDACAWASYLNGGGKPTGPFPGDPFPTP